MVAITVILAAVIAAFVFGLAGSTGTAKNVGLTVAQGTGNNVIVTIQGGTDLPQLNKLEWSIDGATFENTWNIGGTSSPPTTFTVGMKLTANVGETVSGNTFTVRGTFTDGSQQVLIERKF